MKFGKLPVTELDKVDFELPVEPAGNKKILGGKAVKLKQADSDLREAAIDLRSGNPKAEEAAIDSKQETPESAGDVLKPLATTINSTAPALEKPLIYVGGPQWGVPGWVGKIYPPKAKEKDMLANYVQHFNCIELNATHYKIYDIPTIEKWASYAGNRVFKFCPKMYQGITHQGSLNGKTTLINEFTNSIKAFGKYLGPVFIQLSDSFGPNRREELFSFLRSLPIDVSYFLELRHPDWFSSEAKKELFNNLYLLKIGTVITDTSGRRDCVHMHLTVPNAFIRFVANNLHASDYPRLDAWVERITLWLQQGLQELYFFIHMEEELYSPELTVYFADKLYAATGIKIEKPIFIDTASKPKGSQISFFD